MLKPPVLTLAALAIIVPAGAGADSPSSSVTEPGGVITSSSSYVQTNPDGSFTTMLMMVIKKPDGTSVIKTEPLPTKTTRDSQGHVVNSFVIPNEKMAVVDPTTPTSPVTVKIDELVAQRGRPLSVAQGPRKAIYRWSDLEVTVVAGVVTEWRPRNLDAERASEAERSRAAAERQRWLEEQQPARYANYSAPAPTAPTTTNAYIPRALPSKEEQMAQIRLEIEQCRRISDLYFKEISKPFAARSISPAQRDLAEATLARLEQELADLQK